MKQLSLFLFACFVLWSCKQRSVVNQQVVQTNKDTVKVANKPAEEPMADGSLDSFLNRIIDQKNIQRSDTIEEGYWSDDEVLEIGNRKIKRAHIVTYDATDRDRLINSPFDISEGIIFNFNGNKYAVISAAFHMCNGSFCTEIFQFIYDYKNNKLNEFDTYGSPLSTMEQIGDINHDNRLDFLFTSGAGFPYDDSTKTIVFEPYTINSRGSFEKIKYKGKACFIKASFDNGIFAPTHFKIIEKYWFQ